MFENLDNPRHIATWEWSAWHNIDKLELGEITISGDFLPPPAKKSKHRSAMYNPRPMRRLIARSRPR